MRAEVHALRSELREALAAAMVAAAAGETVAKAEARAEARADMQGEVQGAMQAEVQALRAELGAAQATILTMATLKQEVTAFQQSGRETTAGMAEARGAVARLESEARRHAEELAEARSGQERALAVADAAQQEAAALGQRCTATEKLVRELQAARREEPLKVLQQLQADRQQAGDSQQGGGGLDRRQARNLGGDMERGGEVRGEVRGALRQGDVAISAASAARDHGGRGREAQPQQLQQQDDGWDRSWDGDVHTQAARGDARRYEADPNLSGEARRHSEEMRGVMRRCEAGTRRVEDEPSSDVPSFERFERQRYGSGGGVGGGEGSGSGSGSGGSGGGGAGPGDERPSGWLGGRSDEAHYGAQDDGRRRAHTFRAEDGRPQPRPELREYYGRMTPQGRDVERASYRRASYDRASTETASYDRAPTDRAPSDRASYDRASPDGPAYQISKVSEMMASNRASYDRAPLSDRASLSGLNGNVTAASTSARSPHAAPTLSPAGADEGLERLSHLISTWPAPPRPHANEVNGARPEEPVMAPAPLQANELTPAELPGGYRADHRTRELTPGYTGRAQLCPSSVAAGAGSAAQRLSGWPRAAAPPGCECGESFYAAAAAAPAVPQVPRSPEPSASPPHLERRESDERFERIYRSAAPGEALTPLRHEPPPRQERREGGAADGSPGYLRHPFGSRPEGDDEGEGIPGCRSHCSF
eukprot:scaffold38696_cov55-Phaeocystis_antarctica.AAC.3